MDFTEIVNGIPDAVIFERPEMIQVLEEVSKINPKRILEIGTNQGKSSMAFKRAFNPDLLVTVDIATPATFAAVIEPGVTYLWEHDSLKPETLDDVKKIAGEELFDFLFIDGAHFPENVKSDYEMYSPLVRKGGIIAFHDFACVSQEDIAVKPFWDEIKQGREYKEILTDQPIHLAFPTGFALLYV